MATRGHLLTPVWRPPSGERRKELSSSRHDQTGEIGPVGRARQASAPAPPTPRLAVCAGRTRMWAGRGRGGEEDPQRDGGLSPCGRVDALPDLGGAAGRPPRHSPQQQDPVGMCGWTDGGGFPITHRGWGVDGGGVKGVHPAPSSGAQRVIEYVPRLRRSAPTVDAMGNWKSGLTVGDGGLRGAPSAVARACPRSRGGRGRDVAPGECRGGAREARSTRADSSPASSRRLVVFNSSTVRWGCPSLISQGRRNLL